MKIVLGRTLEEWETICPVCNGTGRNIKINSVSWHDCPKCRGFGILDWVELIMGKSPDKIWYAR
jgi:Zn-finger nucleic acid-binding protein